MTLEAGEMEQLSVFGIGKLAEQCKSVNQRVLCLAAYSGQTWMSHNPNFQQDSSSSAENYFNISKMDFKFCKKNNS